MTGREIVYAYPDFETLLVGDFSGGKMMSAKETRFAGIEVDKRPKIPVVKFDRKLLKKFETVFSFDLSNKTSIGQNLLQEDPFERKMIFVQTSSVPGAGNGLFMR